MVQKLFYIKVKFWHIPTELFKKPTLTIFSMLMIAITRDIIDQSAINWNHHRGVIKGKFAEFQKST